MPKCAYLAVCQGEYDFAEVREGAVDALGFFEARPGRSGRLESLGSGKINQVEGTHARLRRLAVLAVDLQDEHRVGPAMQDVKFINFKKHT